MGNGVSTLSTDERAEIVSEMRKLYAEASERGEISDSEIHDKLAMSYEELVKKKTTVKVSQKVKSEVKISSGRKKVPSRRRSFENPNFTKNAPSVKDPVAKSLPPPRPPKKIDEPQLSLPDFPSVPPSVSPDIESRSVDMEQPLVQAEAENIPPNVDSWDSVREQPSCLICKIVFSSATKLDTHLKYSEVHKKNMIALAKEKEDRERLDAPKPEVTPALSCNRCREVYSGSKFFWRAKKTIEINLFVHFEQKCIEVCAYDNSIGEEYPRIYLDDEGVYKCIGGDKVIEQRVQARTENNTAEDTPVIPAEVLQDEERRLAISSHIMSRLQLVDNARNTVIYAYVPTIVAPEEPSPLHNTKPDRLTPVLIPRRRLSSSEEIENVLRNIASLEEDLQKRTANAEEVVQNMLTKNEQLLKSSTSTAGIALTNEDVETL
mmetsp:Transcript_9030/g.13569  ORF Transcript_9030/g.13569 Transcript_9030/m.13569 type:complete len:434 (+) Transcript_9030:35-1336(+)